METQEEKQLTHKQRMKMFEEHYLKSKILKCYTKDSNTEKFKKACSDLIVKEKDVAFIVAMPLTFMHLKDFISGLSHATSYVAFMNTGVVVFEERTGLTKPLSYGDAKIQIGNRLAGTNIIKNVPMLAIPDPNKATFLDDEVEDQIATRVEEFFKWTDSWVNKIEILAAVGNVEIYSCDGDPSRRVEISVLTSYPESRGHDATVFLCLEDKTEVPEWWLMEDSETSSSFDKFAKKAHLYDNWQKMYDGLVELSNNYLKITKP